MFSWGAVAEGLTALASFSSSLGCPAHCHPSLALPLVTGLSLGFVLGLGFGLWLALFLFRGPGALPIPPVAVNPSGAPGISTPSSTKVQPLTPCREADLLGDAGL